MTSFSSSKMERLKGCAEEVQGEKGCTVPSPLTWPPTQKSDGTDEFVTTGSVIGFKAVVSVMKMSVLCV